MQFQIAKKQIKKGSKVYKILHEKKIIDTRISRNDYTSATVFFSLTDGFDVVYHSAKKLVGVLDPVQSKMRRAGYYFWGVAVLSNERN
jgi:hypothetical protein